MKRANQGLFWAIFLLVAGLFLLLKNMDVFGEWGQVVWGGLFAAIGLIFLIFFVANVQQWWRAIPGFVLLSLGASALLEWRNVALGYWNGSLILFGVALAFWSVLLVRRENWWAEVPAGVLTVLGVLLGMQGTWRPDSTQWLIALAVGLGLVFALLYVLRLGERETWWPAVPAAALLLFAVVKQVGPAAPSQGILRAWPALLLVVGVGVLVLSLQRLPSKYGREEPATPRGRPELGSLAGDFEAPPRAPGASVTQSVPDVEASLPARPAPVAPSAPPADAAPEQMTSEQLYEFLKNQPPETPPGGQSG
jgi:hypothetical protein